MIDHPIVTCLVEAAPFDGIRGCGILCRLDSIDRGSAFFSLLPTLPVIAPTSRQGRSEGTPNPLVTVLKTLNCALPRIHSQVMPSEVRRWLTRHGSPTRFSPLILGTLL